MATNNDNKTQTTEPSEPRVIKLNIKEELRFEVENEPIQIQLIEGFAEIFGAELSYEEKYTFSKGSKVAVFTFHGCSLKVFGQPEVEYVATETPMNIYINIGNALEGLRATAAKNKSFGPNVLITGPMSVGKSTFSRILLNYAVRCDRTPVFVDLDLGQGSISIPGNIGAVVVEKPLTIESNYKVLINAPIVFHYGHTSQSVNPSLYDIIMKALGAVVKKKKQSDQLVKYSGTIVNTAGWVQAYGYKSILQAIIHFNIDVVLVLDQERLYSELVRDLKKDSKTEKVKILLVPKSGGVVSRSREVRAEMRDQRIRAYFYGSPTKPLYPFSFDIPFTSFKAYKIGTPQLPDSCLPIGMKSKDNSTKLMPIQPSLSLVNHILAISYLNPGQDKEKVISNTIYGFLAITQVNMDRQVVTVLSPQPKPLPKNYILLLSDVQFVDLE